VRREEDRARLAGEGLEAIRLDYTDTASIVAGLDGVLAATGGRLDALFNNGGYAEVGALEDLATERLRAQFEANFFGWHELTRRVIPIMRRQGAGRIVFCSSVLGFVSVPYRGAYAASKYAIEALADTLRLELHESGIAVVLIEPGAIRSRLGENALSGIRDRLDVEHSVHRTAYEAQLQMAASGRGSSPFKLGPEAVLMRLILALETPSPRARYRISLPTHIAWYLGRNLPARLVDRVLRRTP